jgi:hypothetical protein
MRFLSLVTLVWLVGFASRADAQLTPATNAGYPCLIGFGLYRSEPFPQPGMPDRSKRTLLTKQFDRLVRQMGNDNDTVLANGAARSLRALINEMDDEGVTFWVIAGNPTNQPARLVFYTVLSDTYLDGPPKDGEAPSDRWLQSRRGDIFNSLKAHGEALEDFVIDLEPHEVNLLQIRLKNKELSSATDDEYYAVGLFSAKAKDRYQLDSREMLSFGVVNR